MRTLWILAWVALVPSAAAQDFRLTLTPGQPPAFEGTGVQWTTSSVQEGQRVEGNLTTTKTSLYGVVESKGYFQVARAQQAVPEADDHFFVRATQDDVANGAGQARLVNATLAGTTVTLHVSFPVEGHAKLRLTGDTVPPRFTVGAVEDLAWNRFVLTTQTDEYAFGTLTIWRDAEEPVPFPTTIPSLRQTFPVQGLRENTTYTYRIEFADWAGNTNTSSEYTVTTPARTHVQGPLVLTKTPRDGEVLTLAPPAIEATFEPTSGTISPLEHVRLFVDKREVSDRSERTASSIRYVPNPPLGLGPHTVGLELRDTAGGFTNERWTFDVANPTPGPDVAMLLLALIGLVALRRR